MSAMSTHTFSEKGFIRELENIPTGSVKEYLHPWPAMYKGYLNFTFVYPAVI
jgi:hypothetical protein